MTTRIYDDVVSDLIDNPRAVVSGMTDDGLLDMVSSLPPSVAIRAIAAMTWHVAYYPDYTPGAETKAVYY